MIFIRSTVPVLELPQLLQDLNQSSGAVGTCKAQEISALGPPAHSIYSIVFCIIYPINLNDFDDLTVPNHTFFFIFGFFFGYPLVN